MRPDVCEVRDRLARLANTHQGAARGDRGGRGWPHRWLRRVPFVRVRSGPAPDPGGSWRDRVAARVPPQHGNGGVHGLGGAPCEAALASDSDGVGGLCHQPCVVSRGQSLQRPRVAALVAADASAHREAGSHAGADLCARPRPRRAPRRVSGGLVSTAGPRRGRGAAQEPAPRHALLSLPQPEVPLGPWHADLGLPRCAQPRPRRRQARVAYPCARPGSAERSSSSLVRDDAARLSCRLRRW